MISNRHRRIIGTFTDCQTAERALDELKNAGFSMAQISIVTKDIDNDAIADMSHCDSVRNIYQERRATSGTIAGSLLGAICGCLVGIGALAMPTMTPAISVGTPGAALIATLVGAGIGATSCGLLETLTSVGISEDRAKVYIDRFSRGEYLVMFDGTDDEVRRAEYILSWSQMQR
jgi:uncharacterized membrane protein